MSRMSERRHLLLGLFEFPQEPTSYSLIGTYTSTQDWAAPEDGWFQIEVYGASGHGGKGNSNYSCSGGGGGVVSGGKTNNNNGTAGSNGVEGSPMAYILGSSGVYPEGGNGGAGANGAPSGGKGGGHPDTRGGSYYAPTSGSAGFIKIYRGNTNA